MNRVSVLVRDSAATEPMGSQKPQEKPSSRSERVTSGAVEGAATGGTLALAGGIAALLIPGIGLVLAVESILTVLLGSAAVAASGGLVGALRGWFVPESQAMHYSDRVAQGDYLVAVEGTEADIREAEQILSKWDIQEWSIFTPPTS